MRQIERTFRCRLTAKLVTRLHSAMATLNSCKIGKHRRQSLILANFRWERGWYGTERRDTLTLIWEIDPPYMSRMRGFVGGRRRDWYHSSDHGLLVKRIIESLPRELRKALP